MHVLTIIRMYLGLSQIALAKEASITQPDLCEMETLPPYGRVDKYRRLASVLNLPLEPILKNDIGAIPLSTSISIHLSRISPLLRRNVCW